MKVYNTKGELLTHIKLDAQDEKAGQEVIYVVDTELHDLLRELKPILENIETHLSLGSDEEIRGK